MRAKRENITGKGIFKGAFWERRRHYRGHGVHSPFVYSLVRNVFMKTVNMPQPDGIYEKLVAAGVKPRIAAEIQNLHSYCDKQELVIAGADKRQRDIIQTENLFMEFGQAAISAEQTGKILVVLSPVKYPELKHQCSELVCAGKSLSIYRKGYMLFFFNDGLPRQHFNL